LLLLLLCLFVVCVLFVYIVRLRCFSSSHRSILGPFPSTQDGNPGFVSERTGQPANLFHVVFDDDPNHPYASQLLDTQDMEEYEVLDCLLPSSSSSTETATADVDGRDAAATTTATGSGGGASRGGGGGASRVAEPSKKKRRRS
jgi:hypothetical protein